MMDENVLSFKLQDDKLALIVNDNDFAIDESENSLTVSEIIKGKEEHNYIKWGSDNLYPYQLAKVIGRDEVLAPNKLFNIQACYGAGIVYKDRKTGKASQQADVREFIRSNNFPRLELERITDMKYFLFDVVVLILNKKGDKILKMRHKEATHVRFGKAKDGVIPCIYSANWNSQRLEEQDIERIELLDEWDPLGDLKVRMGLVPNEKGVKKQDKERKFAILTKFPTVGDRYYPTPYSNAFLSSIWFKIKKLIPYGKMMKMKNLSSIRYIVEIRDRFWDKLYSERKASSREEKRKLKLEKMEEIKEFVTGIENSGKIWFSSFYMDPNTGKEVSDVKITALNTGREGGDWSEDAEEANNMACYADGVHPNLVGATPGKSKMNNSGSDKRELYTMKQHMELPFHHLMKLPHEVVCEFNGWDIEVEHPIITLTTLDKGKDAEVKSTNELNSTTDDL